MTPKQVENWRGWQGFLVFCLQLSVTGSPTTAPAPPPNEVEGPFRTPSVNENDKMMIVSKVSSKDIGAIIQQRLYKRGQINRVSRQS